MRLELKQGVHAPGDRIPADTSPGGTGDASEEIPLSLPTQLRHSEQRKEQPPFHNVEVMGQGHCPAVPLWPGRQ